MPGVVRRSRAPEIARGSLRAAPVRGRSRRAASAQSALVVDHDRKPRQARPSSRKIAAACLVQRVRLVEVAAQLGDDRPAGGVTSASPSRVFWPRGYAASACSRELSGALPDPVAATRTSPAQYQARARSATGQIRGRAARPRRTSVAPSRRWPRSHPERSAGRTRAGRSTPGRRARRAPLRAARKLSWSRSSEQPVHVAACASRRSICSATVRKYSRVPAPDLVRLAARLEALEGVGADRLQHRRSAARRRPAPPGGACCCRSASTRPASRPSAPQTASAAASVQPPAKTARRAKSVCSSGPSRS